MKKIMKNILALLPSNRAKTSAVPFPVLFGKFQDILTINNSVLETIATVNDKLGGNYIFDRHYIETTCQTITDQVLKLINDLDTIAPNKYLALHDSFRRISAEIEKDLAGRPYCHFGPFTLAYKAISHHAAEEVGGKNASLAEIANFLDLTIPDGFAVTGAAFHALLAKNDLRQKIDRIVASWKRGKVSVEDAAQKIQQLILDSKLPGKLEKDLSRSLAQLNDNKTNKPLLLAIRSSAWGEDGERSFAGQYESFLNVPAAELAKAYRQVVASAYSETALMYRQKIGFPEEEVTMAVACQVMIDAVASGVLYTLDPQHGHGGSMLLSATWGLGAPVVSGRASGDRFTVARSKPYAVKEMQLVRKKTALTSIAGGGTALQPLPTDRQTQASLGNEQIKQIAATGMLIEKYFKKPQDIEFAIDRQGKLIVLQARPLNIDQTDAPKAPELAKLLSQYPVLFRDQGDIAQAGVATGKVYMFSDDSRLRDVPAGAILVARFASPLLAKVMAKVSAILTDIGSPTGHLATIAREFRVPCIVNTGNATELLQPEQEITVDAEANIVYQGLVNELCLYELTEDAIEESTEYKLLRRVLKNIAPLNLLDPAEKSFTPAACSTLHDITRFVHEKAVEELIDRNYYNHHDPKTSSGKLRLNIPIDLVLIDIDGGLRKGSRKGEVLPDAILSVPMLAFLEGLTHPQAWDNEPMSVDMGSFMSSLTRTFSTELASPKYVGQNLAVISKEYTNISLRLGYHFTMIDSYVTDNINDNYAYFRFFGGVTDETRRSRRAEFIGEVLARHDFRVEVHGDLVVARIKKMDKEGMLQRLQVLGWLVGFTRQLDVKMLSDQHIHHYIDKFNQLMEANI
ncbi:MAG: hypothetical protein KKD73_14400 [Proteobacteria bacterium]|nr:hypothetical protein [Pseudomonadota bacterium]MBU1641267.1 hypothetical protein [Pseudomonadota bacterium]